MVPFHRLNANFSYKREPYRTKTRTVFRDFNIKNLNLIEFIRKALALKNEIFCRMVRALYKTLEFTLWYGSGFEINRIKF